MEHREANPQRSGYNMLDFVEPKASPLLISLIKFGWPGYVKVKYGKLQIQFSKEVQETFNQLKEKLVIICPNHAAQEDTDVIFGVSRLAGQRFSFLTARELFGRPHSLRQKFLQMLGCYSIERGVADVQAFKATRNLLLSGQKVVIFPEGEVSHQNDFLTELEKGVEHIALVTLDELKKTRSHHSIYFLPLALHYRYSNDIRETINAVLSKIECRLGQTINKDESFVARLKNAYYMMLDALEEAHCMPKFEVSLNDRLFATREQLIQENELFLQVVLRKDLSQLCRIHILRNKLVEMRWRRDGYGKKLKGKNESITDTAKIYYQQLKLATNLVALGEHSFDHDLTQEEAVELIKVLELAVCKTISLESPDIVLIGTAKAIDVNEYYLIYKTDKNQGIEVLKNELAIRLKERLLELEHSYTPIMCK